MDIFSEKRIIEVSLDELVKLNGLKGYLMYLSATGEIKSEEYIPVVDNLIKRCELGKKRGE